MGSLAALHTFYNILFSLLTRLTSLVKMRLHLYISDVVQTPSTPIAIAMPDIRVSVLTSFGHFKGLLDFLIILQLLLDIHQLFSKAIAHGLQVSIITAARVAIVATV